MRFEAILLAILLLALGVATIILYSGTPHGGPTTVCGPIIFFNQHFQIDADCRYVSAGELIATFAFFFFALISALSSRPR